MDWKRKEKKRNKTLQNSAEGRAQMVIRSKFLFQCFWMKK